MAALIPISSLALPSALWWEPRAHRELRRSLRVESGRRLKPPPWSRYDWRYRLVIGSVGALCIAIYVHVSFEPASALLAIGGVVGVLMHVVALQVLISPMIYLLVRLGRRERRLFEVYYERSFGCPVCMYDLKASERVGRCPECGSAYDKRSLRDERETV